MTSGCGPGAPLDSAGSQLNGGFQEGTDTGQEDINRNGRVDPGETNPNDASDNGDVPDAGGSQQDGGTQVPADAGTSTPDAGASVDAGSPTQDAGQPDDPMASERDLDCDGLSNGQEYFVIYLGGLKTHPVSQDTDQDGVPDGVELGLTAGIDPRCASVPVDADPSTRTHPVVADTDGDGLKEGQEDTNHDGRLDPGETDPQAPDTDGDGLSDGLERNVTHTNPLSADTDGDTCADGSEDADRDGVVDGGETDPNDASDCGPNSTPDADKDGLPDALEDSTGTNKLNPDTDGDGLSDGLEDRNHEGHVDPDETDPRKKDSDCDGLLDGADLGGFRGEDLNANGTRDAAGETDPTRPDTDQDGLLDGVERGISTETAPDSTCGYSGDADPSTTTDPLNANSDGDGIPDGVEDSNQNGREDPGELDPRDGGDGASNTPAGQACAPQNLRQVMFKEDNGGDIRLALRPSFQEVRQLLVGGNGRGFIGYDDTHKVAFIAYKRGQVGSSTTAVNDELGVRGQFLPPVTSTTITTQTFTTWDGHPAVLAHYDQSATTNLRDYANSVANTLVGSGAGVLSGGAGVTGPYKIQAQYVHRSDQSVVVVLAITPASRFVEPGLFAVGDTAGGSALARFGDADALRCEVFTANNGMIDFLFVVDDSGSMEMSQSALGQAATAVANRLGNSQLDWRIGMVSSSYTQTGYSLPNAGVFRGFTRDINQFKAWLQRSATCPDPTQGCWIGTSGSSDEKTLASARGAVEYMTKVSTPTDKKLRPGAKLVVILLTDVRDSGDDATPVSMYINYFKGANPTGQLIPMHGIICDPAGGECYPGEPVHDSRHVEVIQATGGVMGSIRNSASIQNTINTIMDSAIASAGYRTLKPPIGASVRVAVESVQNPSLCNASDLPRSRVNGFDVDGTSRALSFYGACRPSVAGSTKAAISYRSWWGRTPSWVSTGGR
ncbi:adventurous gliding motility lipoprotein CglD [Archangium sp.]|uniref:adventurous gliding motility lipoprotein CglD n=1 Tax=Archangium sp. TaxID=1872627 RepID=UPI002D523294|nr:adventurous gliding motility lipoprotein CglD [Archangium sp.]HYO56019.1 adventurous gliding motility lipoprotein CglD [Archangium sp.]